MTERADLELAVLAIDGAVMSSLAGPLDTVLVAQKLAQLRDGANAPRLRARLVGPEGRSSVTTATGVVVHGVGPAEPTPDVLMVPGLMHGSGAELLERTRACQAELALIRDLHLRGTRIAAVCSGSFLLAATGLLDGRVATTSWWLADTFRRAFPHVRLEADRVLVDEGQLVSAGAASAQSLTLQLLTEVTDPELAQQTARMLLIDTERQSQAPYVVQALVERPRDSISERVERFLQRELHTDLSVARVAEHCGTSERSLLRHFKASFGASPLRHIQHLRVERAKALLETTHLSLEEIVERCGYADSASFRKLFKRATALTPSDYRSRFRLRAH